jgi:hypothetical protein
MTDILQHVVVTIAALGASVIVVRRVFGFFAPPRSQSTGCPSCPSATNSCAAKPAATAAGGEHPVVFIGSGTTRRRA